MTDTLLIALMVTGGSVCSPLLLSILTSRLRAKEKAADYELRRQEKLEDYKRQDDVAHLLRAEQAATAAKVDDAAVQAAEAARLLKIHQAVAEAKTDETARLLVQSNKVATETAHTQNAKLDQIHSLVNSTLTESLQSELDAHRSLLAVLLVIIALKDKSGDDPAAVIEARLRVTATKTKIAEITAKLADRAQTAAQMATNEKPKP